MAANPGRLTRFSHVPALAHDLFTYRTSWCGTGDKIGIRDPGWEEREGIKLAQTRM